MASVDLISGDRRAEKRYAFEMPLRYLCQASGMQRAGSGSTQDLGRKGVLFRSEDLLPPDAEIELCIEWPFLLQNVCPLELRVWGRVLRSDARGTVVRMSKYEFRTRGERSFDQVSAKEAHWNMVA